MISVRAKLNNLTYNIRHPFDEKEGNRHKIITANCLNSVAANMVGGNFLTGLLIYLNASNFELGIINVIAYVCNILQILSPLLLSRFERMKKMLIGSRIVTHFINIVMIGIISAIPMGSNRVQIYMILGQRSCRRNPESVRRHKAVICQHHECFGGFGYHIR